jgi:hypothetical protein
MADLPPPESICAEAVATRARRVAVRRVFMSSGRKRLSGWRHEARLICLYLCFT